MKKLFRIFAMTAVLFVFLGFSGCSVLSQTSDMDSDYQSTVVPFRAFSEGELSEAGFPEIDISEGWTNVVTFPDDFQLSSEYLLEDAEIKSKEMSWQEEYFFWILMILAGYCLSREMTGMFEKRSDKLNSLFLISTLGLGIGFGVYIAQNQNLILWAIGGLTILTGVILVFRINFLWFLSLGFTYILFLLVAIDTGQHVLPAYATIWFFVGVAVSLIKNLFIFVRHHFRRSV